MFDVRSDTDHSLFFHGSLLTGLGLTSWGADTLLYIVIRVFGVTIYYTISAL